LLGIKPNETIRLKVASYCAEVPPEFNSVVGWTETELDSRTEYVRSQETTMVTFFTSFPNKLTFHK
jgi:hypothetical protein